MLELFSSEVLPANPFRNVALQFKEAAQHFELWRESDAVLTAGLVNELSLADIWHHVHRIEVNTPPRTHTVTEPTSHRPHARTQSQSPHPTVPSHRCVLAASKQAGRLGGGGTLQAESGTESVLRFLLRWVASGAERSTV